jgi:hypothetical protein
LSASPFALPIVASSPINGVVTTGPSSSLSHNNNNGVGRFPTFYHYYGVSMGLTVTCMLRNDSSTLEPTVWGVTTCFGRQMGGDVAFWLTTFHRLAASDNGICGLTPNGELHCSHLDQHELEPLPLTGVLAVEVSANGSPCILTMNGSVACVAQHPLQPPSDLGIGYMNLTVNANGNAACALHSSLAFRCWGATDATRIVTTSPPGETFIDVRVSPYGDYVVACALRTNFTAWCWRFASNKVTDGVDVSIPSDLQFTFIAPGSIDPHSSVIKVPFYASCGILMSNSSVACFGTKFGRLSHAPVAHDFSQIWSGGSRMCAARHSGDIFCWTEDGQDYSFSEYFSRRYRRQIVVSQDIGDDAPFCSLHDFRPCRTLTFALREHRRIATTFVLQGTDQMETVQTTIDRDGITLRDASYNITSNGLAPDGGHSSVISLSLAITSAHDVQLLGIMFADITSQSPNVGRPGGAVMVDNSNNMILKSCSFVNNIGQSSVGGSGLTVRYSSSMTCINCVFDGNSAAYGGAAAWLLASSLQVRHCHLACSCSWPTAYLCCGVDYLVYQL